MTDSNPLIFYDISSPIQPRSYAPNPSKARLALSFKRAPFKTNFVEIIDIADVRKKLNCAAVRKLDDGSDFYTLPLLQDPASDKVIGDSFYIATYLEEKFPNSGGCLFPKETTGTGLDYESPNKDTVFMAPLSNLEKPKHKEYAEFNVSVDATFSTYVVLVAEFMPFNPATEEATRTHFVKRARLNSWDDLSMKGEARKELMGAFNVALASLAEYFKVNDSGPYLEGKEANYADLIVGGWLNMMSECMPAEEWKEFKTWHDGVFGRLHDALHEKYYECK
jgi:glutathione S-transferase